MMSIFEMLFSLMVLLPVVVVLIIISIVSAHFTAYILTKDGTWKSVVLPCLETLWDNAKAYPAEFSSFWRKHAPKATTVDNEAATTETTAADDADTEATADDQETEE